MDVVFVEYIYYLFIGFFYVKIVIKIQWNVVICIWSDSIKMQSNHIMFNNRMYTKIINLNKSYGLNTGCVLFLLTCHWIFYINKS